MTSAPSSDHIVKAFDTQLEDLRHAIVKMGGMAETQVAGAVEALVKRDTEAAVRLIQMDREVDRLEHMIDKTAVRLIALRQPMAVDLREVVSALKISGALERIGDYACNIAQRARSLANCPRSSRPAWCRAWPPWSRPRSRARSTPMSTTMRSAPWKSGAATKKSTRCTPACSASC